MYSLWSYCVYFLINVIDFKIAQEIIKLHLQKAQQAEATYNYNNQKENLYDTKADIWFNKMHKTGVFKCFRKTAKSDYELHACLPVRLSLCLSVGMELDSH